MTHCKCPNCFREHESGDDIKIVFCSECLYEMNKYPYPNKINGDTNGKGNN